MNLSFETDLIIIWLIIYDVWYFSETKLSWINKKKSLPFFKFLYIKHKGDFKKLKMITAVKPWVKTLSIALISGKYCLDSVLENYTNIK